MTCFLILNTWTCAHDKWTGISQNTHRSETKNRALQQYSPDTSWYVATVPALWDNHLSFLHVTWVVTTLLEAVTAGKISCRWFMKQSDVIKLILPYCTCSFRMQSFEMETSRLDEIYFGATFFLKAPLQSIHRCAPSEVEFTNLFWTKNSRWSRV